MSNMYVINSNATNTQYRACSDCTWIDVPNILNELIPIYVTRVNSMRSNEKCIMYVTAYTVNIVPLDINRFRVDFHDWVIQFT